MGWAPLTPKLGTVIIPAPGPGVMPALGAGTMAVSAGAAHSPAAIAAQAPAQAAAALGAIAPPVAPPLDASIAAQQPPLSDERLREAISQRSKAYLLLQRAMTIDTGSTGANAELMLAVSMAMARAGMFEEALSIALRSQDLDTRFMIDIGTRMAAAGMGVRAQEVFEQTLGCDSANKYEQRIAVSVAMMSAGMKSRAQELFEEILGVDLGDRRRNAGLKATLGIALASVGMTDRAREIFAEALKVDMGGRQENAALRVEIGTAMARAGMFDEALGIVTGHKNEDARLRQSVGEAMAQAGKFEEALNIDVRNKRLKAELWTSIGKAMAQAGMLDRARQVFHDALAIDTGNKFNNAHLRWRMGEAMARGGLFEEASRVDTGDRGNNEMLKVEVGTAMAQAGRFDEALRIDTGNDFQNANLRKAIVKAMAQVGKFEEASKLVAGTGAEDASLILVIGEAMAQAGMLDRARRVFREILRVDTEDRSKNIDIRSRIGEAMAQAGMFGEALRIGMGDAGGNDYLKAVVGKAMARAAGAILEKATISAATAATRVSLERMRERELIDLGRILSLPAIRELFAPMIDTVRRQRVEDFLIAGHVSAWRMHDVSAELRRELLARHMSQVKRGVGGGDDRARFHAALSILYHLAQMGEGGATSTLLEMGRREAEKPRPSYLLLKIVSGLDSFKAKEMVLASISSGRLSERESWLLLRRLVDEGYLDADLPRYMTRTKRRFRLGVFQYVHRELHLCPNVQLLENVIGAARTLEAVKENVERLKEQKARIESIRDRHKLVAMLAKDPKAAVAYYMLYGGRTRYALVNNYDAEKFQAVIGRMARFRVHDAPLDQFLRLVPEDRRTSLRAKLLSGQFPVEGESAWRVRADGGESSTLDALNRRAAYAFGSGELGVLIKAATYGRSEGVSAEEKEKLAACNGLADLPSAIAAIDAAHPELAGEAARRLGERWKKLMTKRVLEVGIDQIFSNESNAVSMARMLQGLKEVRGQQQVRVRQEFDQVRKVKGSAAAEAERLLRDGRLTALEEKAPAKLLRYIVQDLLIGEGTERENTLFAEWESHLQGVISEHEKLKERGEAGKTKERTVLLRYLDKRADLVEMSRVADSAQCCFNSKHYGHGAADWIAMLWKDPLSFAFQIEEYPATSPAKAIGFVFGSFGIKDGKPVVLLNGVYMEGKTDAAAQAILREIEQRFSRPLGAKAQIVATRYAGTSKMDPTYSNDSIEVTRLRALARYGNDPMGVIYDDLNVGVNKPGRTDGHVWHKELK
jgi:tetratricopeptide (TPR) repeat protein